MIWIPVVLAVALPSIVLTAWALWLLFNLSIAKHLGLEALKATPPIATAFSPREWAALGRWKAAPPSSSPVDQHDPPPDAPPPPNAGNTPGG